jgi:hypothetical protein
MLKADGVQHGPRNKIRQAEIEFLRSTVRSRAYLDWAHSGAQEWQDIYVAEALLLISV